jgi:hypothetical protein
MRISTYRWFRNKHTFKTITSTLITSTTQSQQAENTSQQHFTRQPYKNKTGKEDIQQHNLD